MEWLSAIIGLIGLIGTIGAGVAQSTAQENANDIAEEGQNKQYELGLKNLEFQRETADKNFGLLERAYNEQRDYNQTVMNREDTAFQRQVEDLKKAGLSPLMVSGGSPATAITTGSAPQYDATGVGNAYAGLGNTINQLFRTKAEKAQIKGALKANIISALGNAPTNMMNSYYQLQEQKLRTDILRAESNYYNEHGYRPSSFSELLSDLIKGINGNKISSPTMFYNFGEDIREKGKETGKKVLELLNSTENNPVTNNEKNYIPESYKDTKSPIALRNSDMTSLNVINLYRMWHFPAIRVKTKIAYDNTLSDYYKKMPNLEKNNISEKDFKKMFYSKNPYLNKLLFGEK